MKITKYKLYLDNGKTRTIPASSGKHARYKFYDSNYHFNTESTVIKVKKMGGKSRRKRSSYGYDILGGNWGW